MILPVYQTQAQENTSNSPDPRASLGLEQGILTFDTPHVELHLVQASQTVATLRPKGTDGFDFTPGDWLEQRGRDGFYHLGDLTLRLRFEGGEDWQAFSTAVERKPVVPLAVSDSVLAAADLAPTLPADIPLRVRRYWEVVDGHLGLRFEIENASEHAIELGAVGVPMVFNNILHRRTLDEAHAVASFSDPYIGQDAGYVQVTRLNGQGPTLIVVPQSETPFEAYRPLLEDSTRRGITFEGFYEWMAHSKAYAENEWRNAEPWNPPTSHVLAPGATRSYGVRFLLADAIRDIENTLIADEHPVAVGISGYVVPMDLDAQLFLNAPSPVEDLTVEPEGALQVEADGARANGWRAYTIRGKRWGRARLTAHYADERTQTIHYKVIKPEAEVVDNLGRFLTTEQWIDDPDDPFGRGPGVISYDDYAKRPVTEDHRAWIAGLGDEGGSGSWLAAVMKQLIRPDAAELEKLQRFVDEVLWGGLQYDADSLKYGVRKSLFYYEPDQMPAGTYSDSIRYGGWPSWSKEHAMTVGRSYNYPHVAAAYWVLYRLARNHEGLATNHPWTWYLEQAYHTSEAMVEHAPEYAQFGQMEGTIFLLILLDLQQEGFSEQASALEATMQARADLWRSLGYPFGSEMPWDSTGQEEVYAWCRYFGYDDKALVTLNAILGYMPTVPHWGYNGSARRYWDFLYAGHPTLSRLERQLHHYGSGLNAIPVLTEYRDHPDDFYLLRVGYGGLMGSISNITQDGFGPSGFHAYPSTLRIDGYSGDYGPNFFGHAVNTGTYVTQHDTFGWLAFGGQLEQEDGWVLVDPNDSARSRVYLASLGLWLTLDAGIFEQVRFQPAAGAVQLSLAPATAHTPRAFLRIEQPAVVDGIGEYQPVERLEQVRGAYLLPLSS
ncbi:MAG TPA: DUF5695 domain-containing protein [Rhodothermales bacterium]|nr:DUF5695 domain-containing protein [Rhodothermales bacterium]